MTIPSDQVSPHETRLLQARAVANRYDVHLRSISRWVARGVIPPPDQVINDRRYWRLETLEKADRERTIEAGRSRPVPRSRHSHSPERRAARSDPRRFSSERPSTHHRSKESS